jgi:hypothetical protein
VDRAAGDDGVLDGAEAGYLDRDGVPDGEGQVVAVWPELRGKVVTTAAR